MCIMKRGRNPFSFLIAIGVVVFVAGCKVDSNKIRPIVPRGNPYAAIDCEALAEQRIVETRRLAEAEDLEREKKEQDKRGIFDLSPNRKKIPGDIGEQVAKLRGKIVAINKEAEKKDCAAALTDQDPFGSLVPPE